MRILLIGGSKSGKSLLAQRSAFASPAAGGASTGPPWSRWTVRTGRASRGTSGSATAGALRPWSVAAPFSGRLEPRHWGHLVFDSATALLACEMFSAAGFDPEAGTRAAEELLVLSRRADHFVCVCDDLFRDGGTYEEWTERYCRGLAQVCRRLAAEFDTVCEVTAGIPHCYKGSLDR